MSVFAFASRPFYLPFFMRAQHPYTFIISIEMNRILLLQQTMDVKNEIIFRSNAQPYVFHRRRNVECGILSLFEMLK